MWQWYAAHRKGHVLFPSKNLQRLLTNTCWCHLLSRYRLPRRAVKDNTERNYHGNGQFICSIFLNGEVNASVLEMQIWHSPVDKNDTENVTDDVFLATLVYAITLSYFNIVENRIRNFWFSLKIPKCRFFGFKSEVGRDHRNQHWTSTPVNKDRCLQKPHAPPVTF